MKSTQHRVLVSLSGLLAFGMLVGCVGSGEEETVTAEVPFEEVSVDDVRNPARAAHHRSPDYQLRDYTGIGDPAPMAFVGVERVVVPDASGAAPFAGMVRASEPRFGTYSLEQVAIAGADGNVDPGVTWVGGITLVFPGQFDMDLTEIIEDGFGNTDFGATVSINDGTFDVVDYQIMFSDSEGKLVYVFNYFYAEVETDGRRTGHLTLRRADHDLTPVEAGQPMYMKLTRSVNR